MFCSQLNPVTKFPTLNVAEGERAMLIKDYHGDWGIIIGKWVGYRKGVAGKAGMSQRLLCNKSQKILSKLYAY